MYSGAQPWWGPSRPTEQVQIGVGRTRSTFAEQLLCRTVLSRLGSELPESWPTLLVSGGRGSQLCLRAPSQGQDSGLPGVWDVWDTPRS